MSDRGRGAVVLESREETEALEVAERVVEAGARGAESAARERIDGVRIGSLVGIGHEGTVPLVVYDGQPGQAALPARATVDLHGAHVGRDVALLFEDGDPRRPVVVGCMREPGTGLTPAPGQVEVEADGERLVVSATQQIVLRCGKASITLMSAGKILIDGAYVSASSTGVLRLKGGSVQIN